MPRIWTVLGLCHWRIIALAASVMWVTGCDQCDNQQSTFEGLFELAPGVPDAFYESYVTLAAQIEANGGECTTTAIRNAFGVAIGTRWVCNSCA